VTLNLKPETEQLVREEIGNGHFHSVDELITEGVYAWREKHHVSPPTQVPLKNLADFLLDSPFAGSELDLEREKDYGCPIDL